MLGQASVDCYAAKLQALERSGLAELNPSAFPTDRDVQRAMRTLSAAQQQNRPLLPVERLQAPPYSDPLMIFESLLLPLEDVKQDPRYHPEGDVLYHSLQVFDHARDEMPYDEEFLTAALLHDVGKGIDPRDHVNAGLEALDGFITERTAWLIEHHMLSHQIAQGSLGTRRHRRLRECEWYEDLLALGECDRAGRLAGVEAPELDEALDYLRDLGGMFDGG